MAKSYKHETDSGFLYRGLVGIDISCNVSNGHGFLSGSIFGTILSYYSPISTPSSCGRVRTPLNPKP